MVERENTIVASVLGTRVGKTSLLQVCLPRFRNLQETLKISSLPSLCRDFGADNTFTTRWSGCRVQVWVQVWAPAGHLAIWWSLPKAITGDYRRSWLQIQELSSWGPRSDGRAQTQGAGVSESATAAGTRCGPRPAPLRKKCYHSCDTYFESQKGFNAL